MGVFAGTERQSTEDEHDDEDEDDSSTSEFRFNGGMILRAGSLRAHPASSVLNSD